MAGRQRIDRVRRQYNQWVANQTLEDYALRFTAKSARRWSAARVANTALGAISFLALEAIGGTITLNYGVTNATAAILVVSVIIFCCGLPIAYHAAKCGIDIDLLTRGAGFGYIGSTITSLIYASFTFIFFAIEAVILATALEMCFGIPRPVGYLISAVVIIPLVTYGITLISRFQLWTQPLWIVLHVLPFIAIAYASRHSFGEWTKFAGEHGNSDGHLDLLLFGTAASVVFSLVAQIGEQVDFLRFLPRDRRTSKTSWWVALLSAGPGWIILGSLKLLAGSFLAYFALSHGVTYEHAAEPAHMYLEAFRYVLSQPDLALALTGTFVILSQLKINVTNAYAGSIAWSNFFSRLTHSHPGRVVWLVFNVLVALLLMEIGVYKALEQTLALYSNVAIAWVGALVSDLVINRPFGLRPQQMEFKRAHLYDINPVGVGAMTIATVISITAFYGVFGPTAKALSAFVALAVAFVAAPLIAYATDGKYYIARKPKRSWQNIEAIQCCICEHSFEPEDTASCPAYAGPICSLCCSLDARCHDLCKPHARVQAQVSETLGKLLPQPIYARINSQLGHYLGVFAVSAGLVALTLGLIYLQTSAATLHADKMLVSSLLWKVFFALTIIIGVVAWLFVLAQQSRRAAEEETRRQTALLIQEIDAHKRTDAELQRAKEVAEAANLAKSRYVVGLSHELRSPLNSISGYAQLLEQDLTLQTKPREQVRVVRRSADHLSGLIDGILDISKIEAGRLYLSRDEVRLSEFLDQLVGMFRLQAAAKGIDFVFKRPAVLPVVVYADEKRLRQILINLLSNAIKFTQLGSVHFVVHYRSPVAEFEVIDTGPGIQATDLDRIFAPFERGALGISQPQTGTGLGLTISRLLAGVMGGDIKVSSKVGTGSTFRVKILLSEVTNPRRNAPVEAPVCGYLGQRKTILITDDDPVHRDLLREVLTPLGFILLSAPDGPGCLALSAHCRPDLFLLDISMSGMDGWTVAETLRSTGHHRARILMVSASALEAHGAPLAQPFHDGYLMKPIDIPKLLETIRQLLKIEWQYDTDQIVLPRWKPDSGSRPPVKHVEELIGLGQIGYIRAIQVKLDEIGSEYPEHADFVSQMRSLVDRFDLDQYMATLKTLHAAREPKKRDVALVVDDSPETLRLLTDALDGAGMTVMVAMDGAAAMRIVDQITPDIVLLDAVMPGMDGFETCRRLKREAGLSNVPVIFMTGLAETEHIVRGLEAGGVDYVTKPIVIEEMLARIRVHLANARLTQSARAALDVSGRFLLAVNRQGKIMWATPQAQRLLSDHLGTPTSDELVLPDALQLWLEQAQKGRGGPKTPAMASFPDNPQLRVHYMGKAGPNEFLLRLAKDAGAGLPAEFSSELGLTTREGEVLAWLSKGKTNRDIAQILGLSPRTVDKHLEQIYAKLGVENRTAAAAIAATARRNP